MKKLLIISIFILIALSAFSNEKLIKQENNKNTLFSLKSNTGYTGIDILNQTNNKTSNLNFFGKGPSKSRRHIIAGITMMSVGGFLFFILSPVFIGCGVYLITFVNQKVAYAGTTSQYYYYEAPYEDAGIVLAVFGGIFFFTAIGLIIAGAVNFALAAKAKKRNAYLSHQKMQFSLVSSFNMENNCSDIGFRYRF